MLIDNNNCKGKLSDFEFNFELDSNPDDAIAYLCSLPLRHPTNTDGQKFRKVAITGFLTIIKHNIFLFLS